MKFLRDISSHTVFLLLLLALLLRLPLLNGSFWLDEAAQALESIRPLSVQLEIAEDFQPPLLHLLIHFATRFSVSEWWLRTVGAVIPGLVTLFFTFKIADRVFTRRTAIVATLMLATSSFHIFYSQELRPYSLSTACAISSWYLLIEIFFTKAKFTFKTGLIYALCTTLGLYSTYLYPFVILSQLSYVLWQERKQLKPFILSLSGAGLLFAPWLPALYEQLQVGQQLRIDLPGWEDVVAIPQLKSLPLTLAKFLFGVLNLEISAIFISSTLILVASLLWIICKNGAEQFFSKKMILLYCWFIVPLLFAWAFSFFIPILQPKRVLYLLPAFYLAITAICLGKTESIKKFSVRVLPLVLIGGINLYSTFSYYTNPLLQREDWRLAYQTIMAKYPTDSIAVFAFNTVFAPWAWYNTTDHPSFATGILVTADLPSVEAKLKKTTEYSYILVFDYLRDLSDPDKKIDIVLEGLGYTYSDTITIPNIGFIRVYARPSAVLS